MKDDVTLQPEEEDLLIVDDDGVPDFEADFELAPPTDTDAQLKLQQENVERIEDKVSRWLDPPTASATPALSDAFKPTILFNLLSEKEEETPKQDPIKPTSVTPKQKTVKRLHKSDSSAGQPAAKVTKTNE
eukprot:Platyproteum_vivax@DN7591_c3_g5_i6.p2